MTVSGQKIGRIKVNLDPGLGEKLKTRFLVNVAGTSTVTIIGISDVSFKL